MTLIRRLTMARRSIKTARKVIALLQCGVMSATIGALTLGAVPGSAQQLTNDTLSATVNPMDGSYQLGPIGSESALRASISALVDHAWLRSGSYPSHSFSES